MPQLEYIRPKTIEEAIQLLDSGIPLAGGTALVSMRRTLDKVIDLQDLDLDGISIEGNTVTVGSTVRLQDLIETDMNVPAALKKACRLEAALNLRNMMTVGGTIMYSDGRSPLLTVLLALSATAVIAPDGKELTIDSLLDDRSNVRLITEIQFEVPENLRYEQVARAPTDFPLVCVCVAQDRSGEEVFRIAQGGFGTRPILVQEAEASLRQWGIEGGIEAARNAYQEADDAWASAAYRSAVVGVLVKRILGEVGA